MDEWSDRELGLMRAGYVAGQCDPSGDFEVWLSEICDLESERASSD